MHTLTRRPITLLPSLAVAALLALPGCDSSPAEPDAKKDAPSKPDTKPRCNCGIGDGKGDSDADQGRQHVTA